MVPRSPIFKSRTLFSRSGTSLCLFRLFINRYKVQWVSVIPKYVPATTLFFLIFVHIALPDRNPTPSPPERRPQAMDPYQLLIYLSLLVILSYSFDIVVKKFKIPAVLLLLGTGMLLKYIVAYYALEIPNLRALLPILGIVGLILIVLEGALDLHLSTDKLPVIRQSLGAAAVILLLSSFLIAFIIRLITDAPFQNCLANAIPLAVISSAITIPSVAHLAPAKREFLIYESTFSDILGIMLFNFVTLNEQFQFGSVARFGLDLVLVFIISIISCAVLLFLIGKIKSHIKFFLIMAVLMLAYALGKNFHLSTLLLVLIFGLVINNTELFIRGQMRRLLGTADIGTEVHALKLLTAESAFLIRTFFFILFGFSMNLTHLTDQNILLTGGLIVAAILLVRFFHLKLIARTSLMPELFIAPRGLITILLFYSIPEQFILPQVSEGILLVVVILTSLLMMLGLLLTKEPIDMEAVEDFGVNR